MERLSDMLKVVVAFPEIFLGYPSLERLYAFIGGFCYANEDADDGCLDGFNEYCHNSYHMNTDHNWVSIIRFFSYDDQHAFETFIKDFNDFSAKSGRPDLVLRIDHEWALAQYKRKQEQKKSGSTD